MARLDGLGFRVAGFSDAESIAALHADSWRRHYRGAYSDDFLDGEVTADRLAVWTDRLRIPDPGCRTIVAKDGGLLGFAHIVFDDDPRWGALVDNLHVAHGHKCQGIGSRLLELSARALAERTESTGLYLWVLEQNQEAQAFYKARGGKCVGRRDVMPPGGVQSRVNGSPVALRYAWPDPGALCVPRVTPKA